MRAASSWFRRGRPIQAKLLLLSTNDKHPHGLANGSDQLGRNYMYHNSAAVLAVSKEPNPTVFQKTLGLNDFYFGMQGFEYPMGNVPDGRQVPGADVQRRETHRGRVGSDVRARRSGQACRRDFWLSTRKTCRCRTIALRWRKTGASN